MFLVYCFSYSLNNTPQALKSYMFLYANDSCLVSHEKNVKEIEKKKHEKAILATSVNALWIIN